MQAEDEDEAARLAGDLKALNDSRKALTETGTKSAYEMIEGSSLKDDRVLVVFLPECHESLAGIIAGRVREKYHRPAFVLTRGEQMVKGSGRSIEAYSMYEELTKCKGLLEARAFHIVRRLPSWQPLHHRYSYWDIYSPAALDLR